MAEIEFKHACSLGNYCFNAAFLKDIGVRESSMPFDWLFTTVISTAHIIMNDFKEFTNKEHYCDVADVVPSHNGRQAGHAKYHPNFFNHKNPRNEEDHQYYLRCIERFRNLLESKEKKLFMVSYKNEDFNISDILKLNVELEKVTTNYHILVHSNTPFQKARKSIMTHYKNMSFYQFWSQHANGGLGYIGEDQIEFNKVFHENFKKV